MTTEAGDADRVLGEWASAPTRRTGDLIASAIAPILTVVGAAIVFLFVTGLIGTMGGVGGCGDLPDAAARRPCVAGPPIREPALHPDRPPLHHRLDGERRSYDLNQLGELTVDAHRDGTVTSVSDLPSKDCRRWRCAFFRRSSERESSRTGGPCLPMTSPTRRRCWAGSRPRDAIWTRRSWRRSSQPGCASCTRRPPLAFGLIFVAMGLDPGRGQRGRSRETRRSPSCWSPLRRSGDLPRGGCGGVAGTSSRADRL